MEKLLKCLVVMLMLMSMAAFTLAFMLFQKRELLKGRTQKLERTLTKVAGVIEAVPPSSSVAPKYPARDIDAITADIIDNPKRSTFWDSFAHELEQEGAPGIDLSGRRAQLACYYQIDPVTLNPVRDPLTGEKLTYGPGTMQEVLDHVVEKSVLQLHLLNNTRAQLKECRQELVHTIEEVNSRKQHLRVALNTIVKRDERIAGLNNTVRARDKEILEHKETIVEISDALAERERDIAEKDDELLAKGDRIAYLQALVNKYETQTPDPPELAWRTMEPGLKGTVLTVNRDWNYAIVALRDDFIDHYQSAIGKNRDIPDLNLLIIRDINSKREFVTKVRLSRVNAKKRVGVADLLQDWKQYDIEPGDLVMY